MSSKKSSISHPATVFLFCNLSCTRNLTKPHCFGEENEKIFTGAQPPDPFLLQTPHKHPHQLRHCPWILFVGGRDKFGLKVRNLITPWKQQQYIKLCLLSSTLDECCWLIAEYLARWQSEWTRKFTLAREAQIAKTVVLSNSTQTTAFDPAAPSVDHPPPSPRTIRKRVNQYIHDIDVAE